MLAILLILFLIILILCCMYNISFLLVPLLIHAVWHSSVSSSFPFFSFIRYTLTMEALIKPYSLEFSVRTPKIRTRSEAECKQDWARWKTSQFADIFLDYSISLSFSPDCIYAYTISYTILSRLLAALYFVDFHSMLCAENNDSNEIKNNKYSI